MFIAKIGVVACFDILVAVVLYEAVFDRSPNHRPLEWGQVAIVVLMCILSIRFTMNIIKVLRQGVFDRAPVDAWWLGGGVVALCIAGWLSLDLLANPATGKYVERRFTVFRGSRTLDSSRVVDASELNNEQGFMAFVFVFGGAFALIKGLGLMHWGTPPSWPRDG